MYLFLLKHNEQRPGVVADELADINAVREHIAQVVSGEEDFIVRDTKVLVQTVYLLDMFKLDVTIVSDVPIDLRAGDTAPTIKIIRYDEWEIARREKQSLESSLKRTEQTGPTLTFGKLINDQFLTDTGAFKDGEQTSNETEGRENEHKA